MTILKSLAVGLATESKRIRRLELKGSSTTNLDFNKLGEKDWSAKYGHLTVTQYSRLSKRISRALSATHRASLHRTRCHTIRKQARAVALARAYFRGMDYKEVEGFCYEQPNWKLVQKLVSENIREGKDEREVMQKFSEWLFVATEYFRLTHPDHPAQQAVVNH